MLSRARAVVEIPPAVTAEIDRVRLFTDSAGVDHPPVDTDGRIPQAIERDDVGLAKSTDISSTQPRDVTDRAARALGQLTDGTTAIAPSAFASATHPRDVTDRAARVVGQLTDGTAAISPSAFGSATHPRNMAQWAGTALTGRDVTPDLAELPTIRIGVGRDFYYLAKTETVASGENFFIGSANVAAYDTLTVDGVVKNTGLITLKTSLTVNGKLINDGVVEVGWQ